MHTVRHWSPSPLPARTGRAAKSKDASRAMHTRTHALTHPPSSQPASCKGSLVHARIQRTHARAHAHTHSGPRAAAMGQLGSSCDGSMGRWIDGSRYRRWEGRKPSGTLTLVHSLGTHTHKRHAHTHWVASQQAKAHHINSDLAGAAGGDGEDIYKRGPVHPSIRAVSHLALLAEGRRMSAR